MEYLTKEWYIAWRRAGVSRGLRPDPLAEQFNESHYKEVYDEELRRYMVAFRTSGYVKNDTFSTCEKKKNKILYFQA